MSSRRMGALLFVSGLIAAVSCGSEDDAPSGPPNDIPGEAGAGGASGGTGNGAPTPLGGDGVSAGAGGAEPDAGGAGTASAGAEQGGESPQASGGAGGDEGSGESGAGGAAGAGGAGTVPPVFSENFDAEALLEGAGSYSTNYVEFSRWDVTNGGVDVTALPNGLIDSPGGYGPGQLARGVVVDLNGSTQQSGTLETKTAITFLPQVEYTLRYVLGNARNQSNAVTVSIAGLLTETRTQGRVTPFTAYETSFTPLTAVTAKLVFSSAGGSDDDGLLLDSVSIRSSR